MVELIEYLQYPWIIRAMLASVIVGITCGVLGVFIVLRNMALIGDALSHAILPGVVLAFLIFGTYHLSGFFAGAVLAGLIAAAAITWIQQKLPTKNDAAIGIIFTVMFAIGVIGISILSRNEGVHLDLNDFLFGNVLGVSQQDLYLNILIILAVVASIVIFYRYFYISTFQESF
nr:metal ABC transporter permease [Saprospiraceae bacterium]